MINRSEDADRFAVTRGEVSEELELAKLKARERDVVADTIHVWEEMARER